jgi:hypothetical protein
MRRAARILAQLARDVSRALGDIAEGLFWIPTTST